MEPTAAAMGPNAVMLERSSTTPMPMKASFVIPITKQIDLCMYSAIRFLAASVKLNGVNNFSPFDINDLPILR